jgi:hypothetical protein
MKTPTSAAATKRIGARPSAASDAQWPLRSFYSTPG